MKNKKNSVHIPKSDENYAIIKTSQQNIFFKRKIHEFLHPLTQVYV